jgi:hypothetical protein
MRKTILTEKQKKQVVSLLKKGMSPKEIFETLGFPLRSIRAVRVGLVLHFDFFEVNAHQIDNA